LRSAAPNAGTTSHELDREYELGIEEFRDRARRGLLNFTCYTKPDFEVAWHNRLIARELNQFIFGDTENLLICCPPRIGKAMALDTPVPTPTGWSTMAELKPGDLVFDETGHPTRVVAKSPVFHGRPCYRVWTKCGESVVADAEHLWRVRLCRKYKGVFDYTTAHLAARTSARNPMVKSQGALVLPEADLPIDPYVLGAWLGDGCSSHATITASAVDIDWLRAKIESCGVRTSDRGTDGTFGLVGGFWVTAQRLGLKRNKHVPPIYFRASASQRLALLQGLMDTDGTCSKQSGMCEFTNTNKRLVDAVIELVSSLGMKCHVEEGRARFRGKDCGPVWDVRFYMAEAFTMPRKRAIARTAEKFVGRFLRFEPLTEPVDTVCIQVEAPSGMFLVGRTMLPTHNSELVSRRMPAFVLGLEPDLQFISASYGFSLAKRMNRDVQRIMTSAEYRELFPGTRLNEKNIRTVADGTWLRNSEMFEVVGHKGYYLCAGVGGGLTGSGGDIAGVDDPFKDWKDAFSPVKRENIWEWFTAVLQTRLSKRGRTCITHTRWNEDDLAGRLQLWLKNDPDMRKRWRVVILRAIKEGTPDEHPDDPREPGEALWPERFPLEKLERVKKLNPMVWVSLYQQRPAPPEGNIVKNHWWKFFRVWPDRSSLDEVILSADLPFKKKLSAKGGSDFASFQIWGRRGADFFFLDHVRARMGYVEQEETFLRLVRDWPEAMAKLIEAAANGEALIDRLRGRIPGIIAVTPRGDKLTRAMAVAPVAQAGNMWLPHESIAPWVTEYLAEWSVFPAGANDDQIDGTSQAILYFSNRINVADCAPVSLEKTSQWTPMMPGHGWEGDEWDDLSRDGIAAFP
jgi:predicted phage terminase large subunit-like protein